MKHPFALLPIVVLATVFTLPAQGASEQRLKQGLKHKTNR